MQRKILTVAFLVALLDGPLVWLAQRYRAMRPGASVELWEYATGVRLARFAGHYRYGYFGGFHPTTEGWLVFFTQEHHQRFFYRLPPESAAVDLPELAQHLEAPAPPDTLRPWALEGYRQWLAGRGLERRDAAALVDSLYEARMRHLARTDTGRHDNAVRDEQILRDRWTRAQRVWASFAFEGVYLAAWVLFAAWPWLRAGSSPRRWAVHVGLTPFVLFLPLYLGYASDTFTFGPSGGFVYPTVVTLAMLLLLPAAFVLSPLGPVEGAVVHALPQVLAPLSQVPGPWMARSSVGGAIGPVGALAIGALIGWLVFLRRRAVERRRARVPP